MCQLLHRMVYMYIAFWDFNPVLGLNTAQDEMSYWLTGLRTSSHTSDPCQTIDCMEPNSVYNTQY
jgi:hypothetical protein